MLYYFKFSCILQNVIQKLVQSDSSLTNIEVVEKCFGLQCKSRVIGIGGGITAKELKVGNSSKASLLDRLNTLKKKMNH